MQKSKGGENICMFRSLSCEAATYFLDPAESEDDCSLVLLHHLDAAPDGDGQRDDDQYVGEEGDQRTADAAVLYTVSNTLGQQQQRGLTSSS